MKVKHKKIHKMSIENKLTKQKALRKKLTKKIPQNCKREFQRFPFLISFTTENREKKKNTLKTFKEEENCEI